MKNDVRAACLALVMSRTSGSIVGRSPRPVALGWKLECGLVPSAELDALRTSIQAAVAGAAVPRRWVTSTPLRALLNEYREVRRSAARPSRNGRCVRPVARGDARPVDRA
jgi:hypothetical protein